MRAGGTSYSGKGFSFAVCFGKCEFWGTRVFFTPERLPGQQAEAKHFWNKSSSFLFPYNAAVYWEKNIGSAAGGGWE